MNLGQRLKQTRLDLGLSQKQVCGDVITRNMLSLIENGAASPSIETLRYLAGRLEKTVSFFLDEEVVASPNQQVMLECRDAFARGEYDSVLRILEAYRHPDPIFAWEEALIRSLACLNLAEESISKGKERYASELLEKALMAAEQTPYYTKELERQRLLLRAQLLPTQLPVDDRELLLRAEAALKEKNGQEAARYLEAAQVRSGPYWNYLRGRAYLCDADHAKAQVCLEAAWDYDPPACAALLERCCLEQEDFKGAYRYACFLRDQV